MQPKVKPTNETGPVPRLRRTPRGPRKGYLHKLALGYAAAELQVSTSHLSAVLKGKRQSASLLRRYNRLVREHSAAAA